MEGLFVRKHDSHNHTNSQVVCNVLTILSTFTRVFYALESRVDLDSYGPQNILATWWCGLFDTYLDGVMVVLHM